MCAPADGRTDDKPLPGPDGLRRRGGHQPAEQLAWISGGSCWRRRAAPAQLELTADYGQRVYTYGIDLSWQREGETVLTITAPENVAGITARILEGETALEYDGMRVETGPLDGSGMSPVDAVPVLLDYAEGGYIAACGMETVDEREVLRVDCREPEAAAGGEPGVLPLVRPVHPRPAAGGALPERLHGDPVRVLQLSDAVNEPAGAHDAPRRAVFCSGLTPDPRDPGGRRGSR